MADEIVAPAPAVQSITLPEGQGRVAAGSVIEIELAEAVSSKLHPRGYKFAIRLVEPIKVEGGVLIPAGTAGIGEVISASRAGMLGKQGELLLAARYLDYDGAQAPLRSFKLGSGGVDRTGAVMAASFVLPLAFVIPGGDIEFPAGTRAHAKLAADVVRPILPAEAPADAQTPPTQSTTEQEPSS